MTRNEALDIFKDSEADIVTACKENIADIIQSNQPARQLTETAEWTAENIWAELNRITIQDKTEGYRRTLNTITRRNTPTPKGSITDADIQRVKEIPIDEVYETLTGNPIHHGMCSCPFHPDNNPSMSLRKFNRFKCFSCDEKGDTIDLYMKVEGVSFIQAVKALM